MLHNSFYLDLPLFGKSNLFFLLLWLLKDLLIGWFAQLSRSLEEVTSAKSVVMQELSAERCRAEDAIERQQNMVDSSTAASAKLTQLEEQCTVANAKAAKMLGKLRTREAELQVCKECLKQLKVFKDGNASKEKLAQLLDVIKLRSQLSSVEAECSSVQQLLDERSTELAVQHQAVQEAQQAVQESRLTQQQAEEEKKDALSKLAILTSYFQEREAQFTK